MLIEFDLVKVAGMWLLLSAFVGAVTAVVQNQAGDMWGVWARGAVLTALCMLSPLVVPLLLLLEAFGGDGEGTD